MVRGEVRMSIYLSPKNIITDFLRKNLTDPRGRISSNSDTFTSTASQTSFSLTPTAGNSVSYIDSITVNAVAKVKWQDYYIDFKSEKIIFFTGLSLADAVIINYGEGSSDWIFPDKPNEKLTALAWPRINVKIISSPGKRLGNYEAPVEATPRVQIDIWTKEKQDNQIFTIDGSKYTGGDLAEYLAYQVIKAFEDNEEELFPALYGYDPVGMPPDLPFSEEMQCHHKTVEFICRGIKIGRIS